MTVMDIHPPSLATQTLLSFTAPVGCLVLLSPSLCVPQASSLDPLCVSIKMSLLEAIVTAGV